MTTKLIKDQAVIVNFIVKADMVKFFFPVQGSTRAYSLKSIDDSYSIVVFLKETGAFSLYQVPTYNEFKTLINTTSELSPNFTEVG